ncbi:WD repeat-containing protein 61 [Flagelloscypha sp. PMI_526]|nr:WD repeat-containing protein 61 [Flagelloscypha sp. PMI_526]
MSLAYLHAWDSASKHSGSIWCLTQPTSNTILTGSADGSFLITSWDGTVHESAPSKHTLGINSISSSKDGSRALWNSIEGTTGLIDLATGQEPVSRYASFMRRGDEGEEPSWSTCLHPSKPLYASTGASGTLWLHSAEPDSFGKRIKHVGTGAKTKFGMHIKWSPTTPNVALSSESGQIYVYDSEASQLVSTFTSHAMAVRQMSWSGDSSLLVSASDDRHVTIHDMRTTKGGGVASLGGHSSWVLSCDISLDGRLLVSGSADGQVKVWDIAARQCVSTIADSGEIWATAWKPDSSLPTAYFVSGGDQGVAKAWRAAGAGQ